MLKDLLGSLKDGEMKTSAIILVIGWWLTSSNFNSMLDRVLPKDGSGVSRGPASGPSGVYASKEYVDARILDLDAKSQLRHDTSLSITKSGFETIQRTLDSINTRMDTLAKYTKHVASAKACDSPTYAVYRDGEVKSVSLRGCP